MTTTMMVSTGGPVGECDPWHNLSCRIPTIPPYSYGWNNMIASLEEPLSEEPDCSIRLDQVAGSVTHKNKEVEPYLVKYVAISKLWYRTVTRLYAHRSISDRETLKMRDCRPSGIQHGHNVRNNRLIRLNPRKSGWVCSSKVCPWCHIRLTTKLAKDLHGVDAEYSVGILRPMFTIEGPDDLRSARSALRAIQKRMSKILPGNYLRILKVVPVTHLKDNEGRMIFRLAYMVERGNEADYPDMMWYSPKSVTGVLRRILPYSAAYLLCPEDQLAKIILCEKNIKTTTVSEKSSDYSLVSDYDAGP
jgi:hypothetical protein